MAKELDPKLAKLAELKNAHERAKRERAEAEGALKSILSRLHADFGVSTLEDAEDKLAAMEKDIKVREAKFIAELAAYEREYVGTGEASSA